MSDIKTNAWFRLCRDALDACERGEPPEHAEASRLTLAGKLSQLPPCVEDMFHTKFVEVPMAAISQKGRIAFVGIKADGSKYVVVRDWETGAREEIYDMEPEATGERIDHLHFPEGSEQPAFVERIHPNKKSADGLNTNRYVHTVYWGDWMFEVNPDASGKLMSIHCFERDEIKMCIATIRSGNRTSLVLFRKNYGSNDVLDPARKIELIGLIEPKLLRVTDKHIVVKESDGDCHRIRLFDFNGGEYWQSDLLDEIVEDSVMERDGEISFVALVPHQRSCKEVIFVTPSSEKMITIVDEPNQINYLPSGRILIWSPMVGNWIVDVHSDNRIELEVGADIREIVEIPSGLVIHDGFILRVVLEHQEGNPIYSQILITLDERVLELRRWEDHLVFRMGKTDKSLGTISVQEFERWLVEGGDDQPATDVYPLYTPFERLVPTEEGILGWHFVNGTFYIIRYEI